MPNTAGFKKFIYPLCLVLIFIAFFLLLESKYPYYFLQDDNRDQFLPYFVHNFRSLVINKEIPLYNPHQFLGTPHLAVGQTAALYPPVYLSVFLSKVFWGHYFASIDILVFLHLVIGSLGFYLLLRLLGLEDRFAFFGAMTWPLSSFVVYVSNSWQFLSGTAAYFPWMIYFSIRLCKSPDYKNLLGLVASRLLLFYIGYVQFFVLALIFELFTFLAVTYSFKLSQPKMNLYKSFGYYSFSYLATLILSLPLLLPMWYQASISVTRSSRLLWSEFSRGSLDLFQWIWGFLYPFSNMNIHPIRNFMDKVLPYSSHIGYVSLVFLIIGFVRFFKIRNDRPIPEFRLVATYGFICLALISFLWAIGHINPIIYLIPVLNRFRWSFKVAFFTNFYLICLAAFGMSLYFSDNRFSQRVKNVLFFTLMLINISNFFYLYILTPQRTFRLHTEEIPYNENLNDKIDDNRIFSVGYSPRDRHFMDGFCFDYATLWGLFHFAGYDPLFNVYNQDASFGLNYVAAYNLGKIDYSLGNYRFNIVTYTALDIPFDYLRKWGVRWYVVSMKRSVYGGYLQKNNLIRKYEDERRIVFSDEQAIPLFYWRHNTSDVGIVYNIKTNSINLDVKNEKDDWLMINFLFSKFFNARVDNALANIQLNNYGQMALFIPEGQHEIVIRYSDPFFLLGVYIAAIFIGILIFCYLYKRTNGRFKKIKG